MQVDVVSPEKLLFSSEAISVEIPGADGDMTAMANHAALITTLRPGILRVVQEKNTNEYVVTGGFAELGEGVSVLAEKAVLKADFNREMFDETLLVAENALESARAARTEALGQFAGGVGNALTGGMGSQILSKLSGGQKTVDLAYKTPIIPSQSSTPGLTLAPIFKP